MIKKLFPITVLASIMFTACNADNCCIFNAITITHDDLLKSPIEDLLIFPADGEEQDYLLTSVMNWMITDGMPLPAWLDISPASGPAGTDQPMKITAIPNPLGEPQREHTVTFSAPNGFKLTLHIRQLEKVFLFRVGIHYSTSTLDEIIEVPTLDLLTINTGKPHTQLIKSIDLLDFPGPPNFLVGRYADEVVELRFDETTGDLYFRDTDGSGYIPIGSHAELYMAHNSDKNFMQEADIDLSGAEWNAIDSSDFGGIYNGDSHVLTGMYANRDPMGIFYNITGTVENLGIIGPKLSSAVATVRDNGAFASHMSASGVLTNCYVSGGDFNFRGDYNGSLIGECYGTLSRCFSSATITGGRVTGGLIGWARGSATIDQCYFSGELTGASESMGGITALGGIITNCYATGNMSGWTYLENFGGITGASPSKIQHCYVTGAFDGTNASFTGGIIGQPIGSSEASDNCALNHSIIGRLNNTGHICAVGHFINILNNAAWDELPPGNPFFADDGTPVTKSDALSASFWTTGTTGFSWLTPWDPDIWDIADGRLPILKNVGGDQITNNPPSHLL